MVIIALCKDTRVSATAAYWYSQLSVFIIWEFATKKRDIGFGERMKIVGVHVAVHLVRDERSGGCM